MKKYFVLNIDFDVIHFLQGKNPTNFALIDKNNGDFVCGWDKEEELILDEFKTTDLKDFFNPKPNYVFGYLAYDAKNQLLPNSKSKNQDLHQFPEMVFVVYRNVLVRKNNELLFYGTEDSVGEIKRELEQINPIKTSAFLKIELTNETSKQDYIKNVNSFKKLIQLGDIYEANYCIQFSQKKTSIDCFETYKNIQNKTKAPFSTFFRHNEINVISGSPERFYSKKRNTIFSQPIKGTAPRGNNEKEDQEIQSALLNNPKEISENVMIVDLVRNDLSSMPNVESVDTPELCQLYSFETVHQLISKVEAKFNAPTAIGDIFKGLFPMGSMTGAPKINACKYIDEIENFKRGIYSGTVGFIEPNGHQDFNVVIRSVLYNSVKKTVSVSVGGAITIQSDPEKEYKECLLKLKAISQSIVGLSNK
ncbi:MAG: chorismate-binding protein [Putridiphycobacter sp.]